ncbi:LysR family transcriptional regulator [Zavarzinia sp.]|uniref:LysR family transcriptional regulator n=1 Tax=Zavarzinia sp. TaxID=2027920 RepID=UPI00356932CD
MNVDNIDLRLLRVFHALAEHGGFAGAQAQLGLTPSTLSIHLSNLEQRLGVVLCERGRGGFRLTDKGERVFLSTKRLFAALEGFRAETASLRGKLVGELAIGIADSTVTDEHSPIAAAIRRFEARDNDVHLRLIVDRPAGLNHALLDGRLNLAVGFFPRPVAGVNYEKLYTEKGQLYCGIGHHLFGKPPEAIDAIALGRSHFVARAYSLERDLNAIGHVSHKASVENMEAQAHLILSGCFIGFLPEHYARSFVAAGRMQAVAPERFTLPSEVFLATPAVGKPNMVVSTFCDDLRRENAALAA